MRVLHVNVVNHNGSTGALIDTINSYLADKNVDTLVAYGVGTKSNDGKKYATGMNRLYIKECQC